MDNIENFDKVMNLEIPEPVKSDDLSTVWYFTKDCGERIARLFKHKIVAVAETRRSGVIKWSGEFDNEEYFLVGVSEGILVATCGEHEMALAYDLHTVAYSEQIQNALNEVDDIKRFNLMILLKTYDLPILLNKIKFQEIMRIFMWEYISNRVEIYETISL
jgi:hypothetical protein